MTGRDAAPLALGLLVAACNGGGPGSRPYLGSSDAAAAAGNDSGVMVTPSGTIKIEIMSPVAGMLLSTNAPADIAAKITVENGNDVVNPSSVRVGITPRGGTSALSSGKLVGPAGTDSLYRGQLSLAGLKVGDYTIVVTAASATGVPGEGHVDVQLDSGPRISVISPLPGGHYKNSLIVQLVADAAGYPPLSDLQATVGGMVLDLQPSGGPDQYRAVVDFNQPVPPLRGDQLFEVSARDAKDARTDIKFVFVVDIVGPAITDPTPPPGAVVGGVIRIGAAIADDAGLNESSLQVFIGDQANPQFKLPLVADGTGTFGVLFDTRNLTACKPPPAISLCIVFPTLSFRAADQLGNETVVTYSISVDNVPPVADLVPPPIRDSKIDGTLVCSWQFDPLSLNVFSGDAPDDLCMVPQAFDLRARVEDDGNRATGLKNPPISQVDPDATAVYVQDDVSQPLVVDTDGDGYCDHINPQLVPTTNPLTGALREVLKVRLSPVPQVGNADFTPDPSLPIAGCDRGHDDSIPLIPCKSEQPTLAITYAAGLPALWAVDPIEKVHHCFGGQFDTRANNVADGGWKCIAVATADLNGNASVSAPIRVWLNYNYPDPQPFCAAPPVARATAPSCTGSYNAATNTVTPGPCRARNFQPRGGQQEICFEKDCAICFADNPRCAP